jgi:menaquinol-cytochrome c reductase iron-sulfur subunit
MRKNSKSILMERPNPTLPAGYADPAIEDDLTPTRRRFYLAAISGLGSLIGAALGIPALLYLFFPPKSKEQAGWVEAADIGGLAVNSPEEVSFRRNRVDGWKVTSEKATAWVVKSADNQVVAFAPQCTHLGCAYHWDAQNNNFLCPCHTSTFGIDGKVLSGPAPRPLDRYETKLDGSKLEIGPLAPHA